ncbi:MAG: Brp/Blh family beta-carotene 15,15'-dioxygenase [Bacteroidota bacterium]
MIVSYPRLWRVLLFVTLAIALVGQLLPPGNWSAYLALLLILFVGIPHGAADHKLFQQLLLQQFNWRYLALFYVVYLGAMGGVVLLWWALPIVALISFVLLSAYHFGQANFHYLDQPTWVKKLLFIAWGLWVIATPIFFHFEETVPILTALLGPLSFPLGPDQLALLAVGMTIVLALVLAVILPKKLLLKEWLSLGCLLCLFWGTPMLLGFGLFFAGWHALPSAIDQIRFFQTRTATYGFRQYLLAILPYSLLAVGGILFFLWLLGSTALTELWPVVFTAIAALTLPHMLLLDQVYDRLEKA